MDCNVLTRQKDIDFVHLSVLQYEEYQQTDRKKTTRQRNSLTGTTDKQRNRQKDRRETERQQILIDHDDIKRYENTF